MKADVFKRYESKYLLSERVFEQIERRISEYMEPDGNNGLGESALISNIYYDTPCHSLIRASLEKPAYKEKIRLRGYGAPEGITGAYAELKGKFDGIVNKRRSYLDLREAYAFMASGNAPSLRPWHNAQVLSEISYRIKAFDLKPSVYIAYERKAYTDMAGSGLRVTFDRDIRTRRFDLRLELGGYGSPLLKGGIALMELKAFGNIPLWLSSLLSEYKAYPSSFSKYGEEYMKTIVKKEPEVIKPYQDEAIKGHMKAAI